MPQMVRTFFCVRDWSGYFFVPVSGQKSLSGKPDRAGASEWKPLCGNALLNSWMGIGAFVFF